MSESWKFLAALLGWLVLGYTCGSIPFGLILLRMVGGPDPRTVGSGNIGATNVTRAGGKVVGFLTLLLDAAKGWAPTAAAAWLLRGHPGGVAHAAAPLVGLAAIVGHCHPAWLRFRGGKGVATFLGVSIALAWPSSPIAFGLTWLVVAAAFRYASLASIAAAWVAALASLLETPRPAPFDPRVSAYFVLAGLLVAAAFITWRHRPNLARLRRGEEPRIGRRATAGPSVGDSTP